MSSKLWLTIVYNFISSRKYLLCSRRFCNYSNPVALRGVIEDDITTIESDVREKMFDRLYDDASNLTSFDSSDFFGPLSTTFTFSAGDKKTIKQLSVYVGEKIEEKGFDYFNQNKVSKKLGCQISTFSFGRYYGQKKLSESTSHEATPKQFDLKLLSSLKEELLQKTSKLIKSVDEKIVLDKLVVYVKPNKNNSLTGYIECALCMSAGAPQTYSVYLDKSYWVMNNYKKHLRSMHSHGNGYPTKKMSCVKNKNRIIKKLDLDEHIDTAQDTNIAVDHETSNFILVIEPIGPDVKTKPDTNLEILSPIDFNQTNEAHYTDETELESLVYDQICSQETEMRSCIFENSEKEIEIPIKFANEPTGTIGACFSKPSGDCLYYSLTHQLFHHKINSKEHEEATYKLRVDVVDYIESNMTYFRPILEGRIVDETDANIIKNPLQITDKVNNLIHRLRQPGCWGGMETLYAVSRLYSVNIIIFNEGGPAYIIEGFKVEYKKVIMIAYCYYGSRNTLNHYNSVTKLSDDDCFKCMQSLVKNAAHDENTSVIEILDNSAPEF